MSISYLEAHHAQFDQCSLFGKASQGHFDKLGNEAIQLAAEIEDHNLKQFSGVNTFSALVLVILKGL